MKYIKISIVILLVSFISIFAYKLTTNKSNNKLSLTKEQMKEMLSYTIDGNKTSSMPSKGSGYKVKSITCKSGSILSWDNDNWLLEVEKLESEDLCNIDFTTGTGSYTVTAVPSIAGSLDSTSKTTTENGQVTFYTDLAIDSVSGCTNEISDGKVVVKNITSNTTCNVEITKNIYNMLLINNPIIKTRTDFSKAYTEENTKTLFKTQENNTDVYYFAGNATDNWVKFGKYQQDEIIYIGNLKGYEGTVRKFNSLSECSSNTSFENCRKVTLGLKGESIYWRIIRTNADGSIRLLYHGNSPSTTSAVINVESKYSSASNDPMYVGYMYGTSGSLENNRTNTNSSVIKTVIDEWYLKHLIQYEQYISLDAVYCSDRNSENFDYNSDINFPTYNRYMNTKVPTYNCSNAYDSFSANNSKATLICSDNSSKVCPIGLITIDEIIYSGNIYNTDENKGDQFLYYSSNSAGKSSTSDLMWYTMSPFRWDSASSVVRIFAINGQISGGLGNISWGGLTNTFGNAVRPVLSIKGDGIWKSGDGSAESPYEIVMN